MDEALDTLGLQRKRRFSTPNYLTALRLLGRSDMVALLPESLATSFRKQFSLAEVCLPVQVPELEIYISWHDRTHRHAAHVWFRDQVLRCLNTEDDGAKS